MIRLNEIQKAKLNFSEFKRNLLNEGFLIKEAAPSGMFIRPQQIGYRIIIQRNRPSKPNFRPIDKEVLEDLVKEHQTLSLPDYSYRLHWMVNNPRDFKANTCILHLYIEAPQ